MGNRPQPGVSAIRLEYRAANGDAIDTFLDRVVLDELVDSKPVREFRWYQGRKHYSGWYWSSTMERLVAYESRLELARVMLADFSPEIVAIAAQPFRMIGADGQRIRRHVPDFLLVDADSGVIVVDVKAAYKRDDPEVRALMRWTARTVAQRGWGFEEWYGTQAQLLANVRFLAGYRRQWLIDEKLSAAGFLRVPRSPDIVYDFLEVVPRTIQHYGVEVWGLIYNGAALKDHTYEQSPYGGELDGKWPIRVNPDDARYVYFQEPKDRSWHRLDWEHAPGLGAPFSAEAARYARKLALQQGRWPDERQALAALLARWDEGMVNDRRERRMAARLAAERSALTVPSGDDPQSEVNDLPTVAGLAAGGSPPAKTDDKPLVEGDDDDPEEIFDEPGSENFYADAFGTVE